MELSLVFLTAAMFACSVARVMRCPETTCRLKLCNDLPHRDIVRDDFSPNMLRADGVDMGGAFCYPQDRSSPLQLVDVKFGEAMASVQKSGDPLMKISDFPDVSRPFPSNYFQVIKMPSGLEKITRKKARCNQFEKTDNLCIVLPIRSYRVKRPDEFTGRKRRGGADDCVALRVEAKKLQVEMLWNNTLSNIDLKVFEPTGIRISRLRKKSPSGGHLNTDVTAGCPRILRPGEQHRETVSCDIDKVPPSGVYNVIAFLAGNCRNARKPLKVCLRVSVDRMVMRNTCQIYEWGEASPRKVFSFTFRM